jgi:hypothetical protein
MGDMGVRRIWLAAAAVPALATALALSVGIAIDGGHYTARFGFKGGLRHSRRTYNPRGQAAVV